MADTATLVPTIAERVALGIAWQDEHDPGWWKEDQPGRGDDGGPIDLGYLDMARPYRCVLGQRWGNYYRAPITLDEAVTLGFDTSVPDDFGAEFAELQAEWVRVITERRALAVANPALGVRVARDVTERRKAAR